MKANITYAIVYLLFASISFAGGVSVAEPSKRELLRKQNDVWSQLDQHTRRVIAQRSEYVYRFADRLVIDAYDLLYWQERLDALLVRKSVQKYSYHNGFRTKETVGYEWEYRSDSEFEEYFRIPTFGALYWYDGVLVNDESRWSHQSFMSFIKEAGANAALTKSDKEIVRGWIATNLPLIVVVDPMAQSDSDIDLYQIRSDSVYLMRGAMGSALGVQLKMPTPKDGKMLYSPGDLSKSRFGSPTKLPDLIGRDLRNGAPKDQYDSYLLVPAPTSSSTAALGPASTSQKPAVFEIARLRQYSVKPKELAVLWFEGKLEIPYRIVEKKGAEWVSNEYLLQRP